MTKSTKILTFPAHTAVIFIVNGIEADAATFDTERAARAFAADWLAR